MKLPHEQYLIYKDAMAKLESIEASSLSVCYITMNKFGDIQEHDDEVFDEGPLWFSYGVTLNSGSYYPPGAEFHDDVWRLLKRRVEP